MKKSVKTTLKILKTRIDYWDWGKKIIEGIYQKDKEKKIENLKSTLLKFKDSTNIYQKAAYQKNKERIEQLLKGVHSVQIDKSQKQKSNFLRKEMIIPFLFLFLGAIILVVVMIIENRKSKELKRK